MRRTLLTCACSLLLSLAACDPGSLTDAHHHDAGHHGATGTYPVTTPLRRDTEISSDYVCQVRAHQHIELRALERGYLTEIFVDEGRLVRAGQTMFQIMPLLYQAEQDRAQAEARFARIEYENTKQLADGDVVSPSELALAEAKLEKAEAELSLARVHRELTEIKAPFEGIMGRFHVRLGSLVEEGELLTELSDPNTLWVYFNVSESEYLDFMSGPPDEDLVPVRLLMANGRFYEHPGVIETVEADFDNTTGNIAFRAAFPNPNNVLRHGQTGKVVMSQTIEGALLVPQKATFEVLDKKYVYVVDEEGLVHSRRIEIAHELPHVYVVAAGLDESDHVLLEGLRKVREGHPVATETVDPVEAFASLEIHAE